MLCLFLLRVPFKTLKSGWMPISLFLIFTFIGNVFNRHGRILISTGALVITEEGVNIAALKTLKVLFMIGGAKILMSAEKTEDIVAGLGRLLSPFEKTGIPIKDFFHTMGLTMKCFPVLKNMASEAYRENINTSKINGFWDKAGMISKFLLPMFIKSVRSPEIFFRKDEINETTISQKR